MKISKKLLVCIMTIIMMIGVMVPAVAFADDGGVTPEIKTAPTLQDAATSLRYTKSPISVNFGFSTDDWESLNDDEKAEALNQYVAAIKSVKIDDKELKDYVSANVSTRGGTTTYSVTVTLNRTAADPIIKVTTAERSKDFDVTVKADGYSDANATLTATMYGAKTLQVRLLDKEQNVLSTESFTMDEIKNMGDGEEDYWYNTICGMAGLRTFRAQGAMLTDILDAAGVPFEEGMILQLRTNDSAKNGNDSSAETAYYRMGRFTYENLMQPRYYFSDIYNNEALKATILGEGRMTGDLLKALGSSDNKVEVAPMLAYQYQETVYLSDQTKPSGDYDSLESEENAFRFLYGMAMDPNDDSKAANETTTWSATYAVFGIDVIVGENKANSPVIEPWSGPFNGKQTVTITADEGDTIYYAILKGGADLDDLEDEDYVKYTGSFDITENCTIIAYAIDESNENGVKSLLAGAEYYIDDTVSGTDNNGSTGNTNVDNNGKAPAKDNNAQTGDDSNMALWAVIMAAAAIAGGAAIFVRRRHAE